MSVTSQIPRKVSTAAPGATLFPYDFKVLSKFDMEVQVDGVTKTVDVDYTLTGVGLDAGGDITFLAPMAGGETVMRRRAMSYERANDFQQLGDLRSQTLNNDQDAPVMMIQQLAEALARCLQLPADSTSSAQLPAIQALMPLLGNAAGTGFEFGDTTLTGDMLLRPNLAEPDGASLVKFEQPLSGAVPRSLLDKSLERVDARDLGVIADGTTNTTSALNAAIAATAAAGRILMLPEAVIIADGLTITSGARIEGRGRGRSIIRRPVGTNANQLLWLYGGTGHQLRGITFDGNKASNANVGYGVIIESEASNYSIEDCEIINCRNTAITVNGGGNDSAAATGEAASRIRNCTIRANNGIGIAVFKDWNVSILDNTICFNGDDGIQVSNYVFPPVYNTQQYIDIRGNRCYENAGTGISIFGHVTGGSLSNPVYSYGPSANRACRISDNVCTSNDKYGILVQGDGHIVQGNLCYFNGDPLSPIASSYSGITGAGRGIKIIGNTCEGNSGYGIDSGIYQCVISGNYIARNSKATGGRIGLNCGASIGCVISNNVIEDNGPQDGTGENICLAGIDGDGVTPMPNVGYGCVITGNTIISQSQIGIRIERQHGNGRIQGNIIIGGDADKAIQIETTRGWLEKDNTVTAAALDTDGGKIPVASASTLRIHDYGDLYEVSGSTNITKIQTDTQFKYDGKVMDVQMSSYGSGYTSAPTVSFSGGGGTGAAATAELTNDGRIMGVKMTNPGSGYTSMPTVSFTGGGGAGAAGIAVTGNNINGRQISLVFTGTLTVVAGTGLLVSGGSYNATPGKILTLRGTGNTWREVARS